MLACIKNGQLTKKSFVRIRRKKNCEAILKLLWREGFIIGYQVFKEEPDVIKIFLKRHGEKPAINNIKLISKPGRRINLTIKQVWKIKSTEVCIILSTNKGIKTLTECKKLGIGGEPFIFLN